MCYNGHMEQHLYSVHNMPTFQNVVYNTSLSAQNCPQGDIDLVQDSVTGLIHNSSFDSKLMIYDESYQNEQSLSTSFAEHLEQVSEIITLGMGKKEIIEVGCGKGFFLEMLQKKGFDIDGFDTTSDGKNLRIKQSFFDADSGIKGKGIILRHVLEHIQDPLHFLQDLCANNNGKGIIYIEVPCFDWICKIMHGLMYVMSM